MILGFRAVILRVLGMLDGFLVIPEIAAFGGMAMFFGRFIAALGCFRMMFGVCSGGRFCLGRWHGLSPVFGFRKRRGKRGGLPPCDGLRLRVEVYAGLVGFISLSLFLSFRERGCLNVRLFIFRHRVGCWGLGHVSTSSVTRQGFADL
jgi:hypothetical protein